MTRSQYRVVRFYFNRPGYRTILNNMTLAQAQAHCQDPETSSQTCTLPANTSRTRRLGPWFDRYYQVSQRNILFSLMSVKTTKKVFENDVDKAWQARGGLMVSRKARVPTRSGGGTRQTKYYVHAGDNRGGPFYTFNNAKRCATRIALNHLWHYRTRAGCVQETEKSEIALALYWFTPHGRKRLRIGRLNWRDKCSSTASDSSQQCQTGKDC